MTASSNAVLVGSAAALERARTAAGTREIGTNGVMAHPATVKVSVLPAVARVSAHPEVKASVHPAVEVSVLRPVAVRALGGTVLPEAVLDRLEAARQAEVGSDHPAIREMATRAAMERIPMRHPAVGLTAVPSSPPRKSPVMHLESDSVQAVVVQAAAVQAWVRQEAAWVQVSVPPVVPAQVHPEANKTAEAKFSGTVSSSYLL